jgi:hypothetical protein
MGLGCPLGPGMDNQDEGLRGLGMSVHPFDAGGPRPLHHATLFTTFWEPDQADLTRRN